MYSPEEIENIKGGIAILRALIEECVRQGDHDRADYVTASLEVLHRIVEEAEGASVDPDDPVCGFAIIEKVG